MPDKCDHCGLNPCTCTPEELVAHGNIAAAKSTLSKEDLQDAALNASIEHNPITPPAVAETPAGPVEATVTIQDGSGQSITVPLGQMQAILDEIKQRRQIQMATEQLAAQITNIENTLGITVGPDDTWAMRAERAMRAFEGAKRAALQPVATPDTNQKETA